jgi:hypothetical protein
LDVLASLAWAGVLTTAQVERLHYPSRRTAQRGLRALLDLGFVRAHRQGDALHLPDAYTLSPEGAEALAERRGFAPGEVRPRRLPRRPKLAHSLAVRDLFVAFRLAAPAAGLDLDDLLFDEDLGDHPVFSAAGLVPDALAALVVPGVGPKWVACEVDRGTEKRATLEAKLAAYRPLLLSAAPPLGVGHGSLLVTTTVPARVVLVERVVGEMGLKGRAEAVGHEAAGEAARALCTRPLFAPPVRAARTDYGPEGPIFEPI